MPVASTPGLLCAAPRRPGVRGARRPVMFDLRRLIPLLLALAAALLAPAAALADGEDVLRDCNDNGKLDKRYSQGEYRDAIENIPTDLDEYTDCRDVIRRAQLGLNGSGSGDGTGGSGGATGGGTTGGGTGGAAGTGGTGSANATEALADATPEERAALEKLTTGGGGPGVTVGEELLRPGSFGFDGVASSTTLPAPLIVLLVLLGLGTLGGATYALRDRVGGPLRDVVRRR